MRTPIYFAPKTSLSIGRLTRVVWRLDKLVYLYWRLTCL